MHFTDQQPSREVSPDKILPKCCISLKMGVKQKLSFEHSLSLTRLSALATVKIKIVSRTKLSHL